jgi:lipopolysaccharide/colanic/teichoic acid biosynthesis glycosyltransferase
MKQEQVSILADRFVMAQTPAGRWRLRQRMRWQRMRWQLDLRSGPAVKRAVDIAGSLMALMILSPIYLLIALLIKVEDRGPILFCQTRVGRFGRHFRMYKFRSMCPNAEERMKELLAKNIHSEGITFKIKDDPRITRVGKWLRKLSLDELPQFYNVLIGDMSLVGPRPPVPREVECYSLSDRRRLETMPGITCFWQIGGRAEIDFSGQVQLDVLYIERQNFWTDVKILLKTVPAVMFSKGAY